MSGCYSISNIVTIVRIWLLLNEDASWNKQSVIGRLFGTDNRPADNRPKHYIIGAPLISISPIPSIGFEKNENVLRLVKKTDGTIWVVMMTLVGWDDRAEEMNQKQWIMSDLVDSLDWTVTVYKRTQDHIVSAIITLCLRGKTPPFHFHFHFTISTNCTAFSVFK